MDPVKCDICGEEIPLEDLNISKGKPIRFCKGCKKGLADGFLPGSANKKSSGLFNISTLGDENGLYRPPKDKNDGLCRAPENDTGGLYKPDQE